MWAFGLAFGVVGIAYRLCLLTWGGALSAIVVGTSVFGVGGWQPSILLVFFFFTSSLLPRVLGRKRATERRTLWQVLANGGVPVFAVWIVWFMPEWSERAWLAYTASLACANGDTWATEIGIRFGRAPRLITTGRRVLACTSGGVSLAGTLGALLGCGTIAVLGYALLGFSMGQLGWTFLTGFVGVMVDSLLGATVQARFICARCGKQTESPVHCGLPARLVGGWRKLDNNGVNAFATLFSGVIGFVMGR